MKTILFAALCAACLLGNSSRASNIIVSDYAIQKVSLFSDGAIVTRRDTIDFPEGKSTVRFEGIPDSLDPRILQAALPQDAYGVIRNAQYETVRLGEGPESIAAFEESINALKLEIQEQKELREKAKEDARFAQQIADQFSKNYGEIKDGITLSIEQARETWNFAREAKASAAAEIDAANDRIRELQVSIDNAQAEIAALRKEWVATRRDAVVEVEFARPQTAELSLDYFVSQASWTPKYELRADAHLETLNFGYFASISQATGEDWEDVILTLNTSAARRSSTAPSMQAWHLAQLLAAAEEVFELSPFEVEGKENEGYRATHTLAGSRIATDLQDVGAAIAALNDSFRIANAALSFNITLPSTHSIASDDGSKRALILSESIKAEYWTEAMPRLTADAFLKTKFENTLPIPLLAGEALVFVGNTLSSRAVIPPIQAGEKLELSMGRDPNVAVERIAGDIENSNTGIIDRARKLRRSYENVITSYYAKPHKIVVVDQFPIANDDEIQITRIAPLASNVVVKEHMEETGIFQWEATLNPKEAKSFEIKYEVEHPRDWQIANL